MSSGGLLPLDLVSSHLTRSVRQTPAVSAGERSPCGRSLDSADGNETPPKIFTQDLYGAESVNALRTMARAPTAIA